MPEIKQNFTQGVMDLGSDARLIANGTYRYALNIDVAGSESSDQGVVQNIRGNVSRGQNLEIPTDNPIVIGGVSNESENKIYYFWVSQFSEGIYEYDVSDINTTTGSGTLNRILEFTKTDSSSHSFLNFNENNLITGAVVVDNLLIWTDGINPVRKVNIDRFRGSGNFITCPQSNDNEYVCPEGSVTRDNPRNPTEKQFLVSGPNPLYDGNGDILVDTDTGTLVDEIPKSDEFSTDLINLAKRPPLFPPTITKIVDGTTDDTYEAKGSKPEDKLYDTLARFAIRYRYTDGETSALSPFSQAAFMPKRYSINTETGLMESMTNYMREVEITFDVGENEVKEIDIIYKESDSSAVYIVETINKEAGNGIKSSTKSIREYYRYTYDGSKIYRILPSSELARIYDNVPIKAKALDMAGNRLVLGNYTENYTFTRFSEDGTEIIPDFEVDYTSIDKTADVNAPFRTCKTGRDYQVGLVYLDRNGRQSPVVVAADNTIHIPFSESQKRNRLFMTIKSEAPYWATHYRPFVKQNKGVFYNIIPSYSKYIWQYDLDDDDTTDDVNKFYLKINDADINKVDVGDVLVRKISKEEVIEDVQYWRVTETKRFVSRDTQTFADNKLPGPIPNSEEGYYVLLAPTDNNYDLPAGQADFSDVDSVWETVPLDIVGDFYWETSETYRVVNGRHTNANEEVPRADADIQRLDSDGAALEGPQGEVRIELDWFNAYGYGIGVESMVVEDRFNGKTLDQGARASTVQEDYRQADKQSWVIHSGIYNDSTNLNRLNEFNVSLPLQKELDVNDGSIQKLHFRNTDLYVFQERKVKRVPINKNTIITADGGNLSTAGSQFFGTEIPYAGNYGISTNPESFATYGSRIYFADKNRGAILRLGGNGITEISKNGVEAYVRRYIKEATYIKLSYNDYADELDISFQNANILQQFEGNRRERRISAIGLPDPQYACTVRYRGLDFEPVYSIMFDAGGIDDQDGLFEMGDTVYSDSNFSTPYRGDYRWFRVQQGSGASATYNQAIQISNDGVVAAVITDCKATYPRVIDHREFTVSTESFQTELDACANGVLDQIAYFGPGSDQIAVSAEPQEGNIIYEAPNTLIRSSRNGWYKINVADTDGDDNLTYEHYVILVRNGVVVKTFHCDRIEKGRVRFTGSKPLPVVANETSFDRNLRLCTSELEEGWWLDVDRDYPLIGDTIYENNFTDDTIPAGYLVVANGVYFEIDANGKVTSVESCGEIVCTNEPTKYMIPYPEVPIRQSISLTHSSSTDNSITFDVNAAIKDYKLNDYYELDSDGNIQYRIGGVSTGATCTTGDNCLPTVANDVANDSDVFENNDLVSVTLIVTENSIDTRYDTQGRLELDSDDNFSLIVDNSEGLIPDDSDLTYVIQIINNNYKQRFLGVEIETTIGSNTQTITVGLPKMTLSWFEKGVKRYPNAGSYETILTDVEENRNYKVTNTAIPEELAVTSVVSELCYDQVTGGSENYVFVLTTGAAEDAATGRCQLTTNDTWYYNPDVVPKTYYSNATLDEESLIDGNNLYFGIAYDNGSNQEDNASTNRVEFVDQNGVVDATKTINCAYSETQTLSYVAPDSLSEDPEQLACKEFDDGNTNTYWADGSDFTPDNDNSDLAERLLIQDGKFNFAADGWYADNDVVRQMVGGVLSSETTSCITPLTSSTIKYSAASADDSCKNGTDTTVYNSQSSLTHESRLYDSAYRDEYLESGYYSNSTVVGFWNKQLGDFETFGNCDYTPPEDPPKPPPPVYRVQNSFYYHSTEEGVCQASQRTFTNVYSLTDAPFDDDIFANDTGDDKATAGYYWFQEGKVYRHWDGEDWTSDSDQECITTEDRPRNDLYFASSSEDACGESSTSQAAYYNGAFNDNTKEVFYSSAVGTGILNDGISGFYADSNKDFYRPWDGAELGSTTECPTIPSGSQLYTNNPQFGYADSKRAACARYADNATSSYYIDAPSFTKSTAIYEDPFRNFGINEDDYDRAEKGWYANETVARQWNGTSFVGGQPCDIIYMDIDGVRYSQIYEATFTQPALTVTGSIIVDSFRKPNLGMTATISLGSGCYARAYRNSYDVYNEGTWNGTSYQSELSNATLTGELDGKILSGIGGTHFLAEASCGNSSNNTLSLGLGPVESGVYNFTFTIENDDWAGVNVPVRLRLGLNGL